ncbi:MAG: cation transporter [Planctomycetes bacterium]|nr:cation transporter [Planctomycetota bacterium]
MEAVCPAAGKPGKRVPPVTVRSLVRDERASEIDGREWFFCDLPDCQVVYFAQDGKTFSKEALKVRVGVKEKVAPRPVCYCFGHTVESIRDEIARTGRSTVLASITAEVKAGECSCETMNPKGTCCLGDVSRAVKEAIACSGTNASATPAKMEHSHDCCSTQPDGQKPVTAYSQTERAGLLAAAGSVFSAVVASACCWLPLLLLLFGVSAAGVSAAFERVRPIFLVIAPLLLASGFYSVYFRREKCAADGTCKARNPKLRRFSRAMLWISSVVVLVVALFPNYVGLIHTSGRAPISIQEAAATPEQFVVLRVEGMTCKACAVSLEKELLKNPGVLDATVNYPERRAIVKVKQGVPADKRVLVEAVERAGYQAKVEPSK